LQHRTAYHDWYHIPSAAWTCIAVNLSLGFSHTLLLFSKLEQILKNAFEECGGTTSTNLTTIQDVFFWARFLTFSETSLGRHTRVNGRHYTGGSKVLPSQIVSDVPMCERDIFESNSWLTGSCFSSNDRIVWKSRLRSI
jgi:hypothetical protein